MNWPHAHLIVNHLPVVGFLFATLCLAYALYRREPLLLRTSLLIGLLVALSASLAAITGHQAEEVLEHLPGFSELLVEAHEEAATLALVIAGLFGVAALGGSIFQRTAGRLPRGFPTLVLLLSLAATLLMGWTANRGGQISHPEVRGELPLPSPETE